MTEKNVILDVSDFSRDTRVSVVCGDTKSRRLIFSLCSGARSVPLSGNDITVLLRAKIGSTTVVDSCELEDGFAVCTLSGSFTATPGVYECELAAYRGAGEEMEVLHCPHFTLEVFEGMEDDGELEASDSYSALEALINSAAASDAAASLSAEAAAASAAAASAAAESVQEQLSSKADADTDAIAGHLAMFAADGNPIDSGKAAGAIASKVSGGAEGNLASLTSGGDIADSGYAASDFLGKSEVLRWSDSQTSYAEQNKEVLARLNALPDEKVNVVLVANGSRLSLSRRTSNGAYYFSGQTQSEDQLPCEYMLRRAGALYREVKYDLIANEEILEDDFIPPTSGLMYTLLAEKGKAWKHYLTAVSNTVTLADCTEWRLSTVMSHSSLIIVTPSGLLPASDSLHSRIIIRAAQAGMSVTDDGSIVWRGDDCTGGDFIPVGGKTYEADIRYLGLTAGGDALLAGDVTALPI